MILDEIRTNTALGRAPQVKAAVAQALSDGISAEEILNKALLTAMNDVGEKFKAGQAFVPNMLVAARAMTEGLEVLKPHLTSSGANKVGKAVIGTVKGDRHDIGKKLVGIMLQGKGFDVIDLGVDVPAQQFIDTAIAEGACVICCSALLTTTVPEMQTVVGLKNGKGLQDKLFVLVGGAAVTQEYALSIGADGYTEDAASCADLALTLAQKAI